jgi:hypothetical protein
LDLRTKVSKRIDDQRKTEFRKINATYKDELTALKERQRAEDEALAKRQSEESRQRAKAVKEQADLAASRQENFKRTLRGFKKEGRKITQANKVAQDFDQARDKDANEEIRKRLRARMSRKIQAELKENAKDMTTPRLKPTRDFEKARGALPPEVQAAADKDRRVKTEYRAFRDMADEVTQKRGKGGGRSIIKKPPKGPEFR